MYEGEDVELPCEQSAVIERDPEKNTLYKLALGHLQNAQAEMQEPKFDKTSCTSFRDALVALSGVWNVFSNEANKAFQDADRQQVEELCRMTELENKDADVVEILNTLADKSPLAPLTDIVNELYILLSTKPHRRRLLLVLLTIGEQGCAATALSKSQLAKVFDTGTTTRKCDCLFTVKGLEVGNIEAKRSSATKLEEYYQKFSVNYARSFSFVQYEERAALEDYAVSLSPKDQATRMEWEHVVLHTPTKSRLSKKNLPKAPDNAHFWTKIESTARNHEDEEE
ncbi:hypothetical protein BGZ97_003928 [Linnemannia gamsii]|uniref:Uncharacterized protein n=1 Tax=Linnemannia gamsii TaxID=64522 RepID=A0A9P6UHD6_9FUNG|nr:hypothetical protein BGZ97_003928 [Linnemannia gamsii]